MYCPKCASQAVEGQRFCRQCGTNLGIIVDAMDGRRGPIDFDSLKEDLRQLGQSLRSSFEEASREIKKTKHQHKQHWHKSDWNRVGDVAQTAASAGAAAATDAVAAVRTSDDRLSTKPIPIKIKRVRGGSSRQHSFQQALLSIFSGGATSAVLYYFLNTAADSGFLLSLEQLILRESGAPLVGLVPIFQSLWMLGLVPVAKGVAHLFNGIFFPANPTEDPADLVVQEINERLVAAQPIRSYIPPVRTSASAESDSAPAAAAPDTDELNRQPGFTSFGSVTEDPTARFDSPASEPVGGSS